MRCAHCHHLITNNGVHLADGRNFHAECYSRPRLIATLPEGERVIDMIVWQDRCILALTCGVYEIKGDNVVPLKFVEAPHA